jgi:hypothetical protein
MFAMPVGGHVTDRRRYEIVDNVNAAARGCTESRRRQALFVAVIVGASAWALVTTHDLGVLEGALFGVGLQMVIQLVRGIRYQRRARHRGPDVLAAASAYVRTVELTCFDATQQPRRSAAGGAIDVRRDGFAWEPLWPSVVGPHSLSVPWSDVRELNCLPAFFGLIHSCCFVMHDGRELLFQISFPAKVELAVALLGVPVTGKPSRLTEIAYDLQRSEAY